MPDVQDSSQQNLPITEDWLKSVGFKWHQFDRQPNKQWLLWLGDAMNGGGFSSFEDIGVELASGAWNQKRDDHEDWYCWLRGDSSHRYHRFIHVRHIRFQHELIRLVEGLTGQDWDPANHQVGSCMTPEQAERIRREQERRDLRENWRQRPPWGEVEKAAPPWARSCRQGPGDRDARTRQGRSDAGDGHDGHEP